VGASPSGASEPSAQTIRIYFRRGDPGGGDAGLLDASHRILVSLPRPDGSRLFLTANQFMLLASLSEQRTGLLQVRTSAWGWTGWG